MKRSGLAVIGVASSLVLTLGACGSDDEEEGSGGGGESAGSTSTLDIGLVAPLSGGGSPGAAGLQDGVEARFAAYEAEGGKCADQLDFNVITADEASSPQGNLAAIQKLTQQDEVYAILSASAFFNGGIQFATTQAADVPIVGYALDGPSPQWLEFDNNLFSAFPLPVGDKVYTTIGDYLAGQGATKVAGVAFSVPASQEGLENGLQSAEAAGLQRAYVNDGVQFGSTDVGPIVLGIIDSGADAVYMAITSDTSLAVVAGLRQNGWEGTVLLPTGYGNELLQSEPAVQAAQGVTFSTSTTPTELQTEATERLSQALSEQTGEDASIPGFFQLTGWVSADLFLYGLDAAGCDASQQEFIDTLRQETDYDAGGLLPQPTDFTSADYDQQCSYYLTVEGEAFVPVEDASPVCGTLID